jgi:NADPH:quinone reductase-like Zn-dependent oxidoreductase
MRAIVRERFGGPDCLVIVAAGRYNAKPSRVFRFEDIREAHRVMESNEVVGKIVVRL